MTTLITAFITITILSAFTFTSEITYAAETQSKRDKVIVETLLEASKEVNAQLPLMVDKDTRLDTTIVVGKQMHYKYTLVNASLKDLDLTATKKEIRSLLVNNQCSNDNMLKLLKMGVVYQYMYQDKNGRSITTIKINKKDCGF